MGLGQWFDKVTKTVEDGAAKKRARDAGNRGVDVWLKQRQSADLQKAIAVAQSKELAKREAAAKRRAKKLETTAKDKELADLSTAKIPEIQRAIANHEAKAAVVKAKKSAGSTTTVKSHDRKGSDGVKTHQRKMTAAEKRAHTAQELLKDNSVEPKKASIDQIRSDAEFVRFVQQNPRYDTDWFGDVHVSYLKVNGRACDVKKTYADFLKSKTK